jgi:hypothetical protein
MLLILDTAQASGAAPHINVACRIGCVTNLTSPIFADPIRFSRLFAAQVI